MCCACIWFGNAGVGIWAVWHSGSTLACLKSNVLVQCFYFGCFPLFYNCDCVLQVPLEELLDDLEGLNIGSEDDQNAHAQHPSSDVDMMEG